MTTNSVRGGSEVRLYPTDKPARLIFYPIKKVDPIEMSDSGEETIG